MFSIHNLSIDEISNLSNMTTDIITNITTDIITNITTDIITNITTDIITNITTNITEEFLSSELTSERIEKFTKEFSKDTEKPLNSKKSIHKKVKELLGKSYVSNVWAALPAGRDFKGEESYGSCPILQDNSTLKQLIPGWEGLPSNIILNSILTIIIIFGFSFLIRRVYKTERLTNKEYLANERSSDWIHFIYGKRGNTQSFLYSSHDNRDDPKAYLPFILHNQTNHIKGKIENDSEMTNIYKVKSDQANENPVSEEKKNESQTISDGLEEPTLRSQSIESDTEFIYHSNTEEEENNQMSQMKSILWDAKGSTVSSYEFTYKAAVPDTGLTRSLSFSQWLKKYIRIKDIDIYNKRGFDAFQYLLFQRYIIYFLLSLTIICMFIILPVNLYADKLGDKPYAYYKRTTILNVKKESPLIYIHSLMTIFVVIIGIYLMTSFNDLIGKRVKNIDRKTLLIENIPKWKRTPIELKEFLVKKFPNVVIKQIYFVYDINKITKFMLKLWTAIEAKNYCQLYQRMYGQRCEVRPYCLGNLRGLIGCCLCSAKVDGLEYYIKEKKELEIKLKSEFYQTMNKPERLAFVRFQDKRMAAEVYNHYRRYHYNCYYISIFFRKIFPPKRDELCSKDWKVSYAPYPDDINWLDMAVTRLKGWTLILTMNCYIAIIFLFISTPSSVLDIFRQLFGYEKYQDVSNTLSDPIFSIFWSYIPTLMYTIATGALPAVIKLLATQMPYQTKSDYNHSIMSKSFVFLILMVLILPSLAIITVYTLFESQFNLNNSTETRKLEWSCLFPAENGVFFLNYILTSIFVGNVMEFIRISELIGYFISLLLISRTTTEYLTARLNTKFEFQFGIYYPRFLLLFTLVVTFSISNPLIAPIGLIYMTSKHLLDRYLIYYVYIPTKISHRIHSKAIVFVYFSLLFLLLQVYTHLASMRFQYPSWIVGTALMAHFFFSMFQLFLDCIYFL